MLRSNAAPERLVASFIVPAQSGCREEACRYRSRARRTNARRHRGAPARDSRAQAATRRDVRRQPLASGDAHDCGRPRDRGCDPRRTRPEGVPWPDPARLSSFRRNRKCCADRVPTRETTNDHGRARSGREVGATLGTPAPDDCSSPARAHPDPESVLLVPFPVVGLERPLHAWPPRARPNARPKWGPGAIARASGMVPELVVSRAGGRASVRRSAGRSNPGVIPTLGPLGLWTTLVAPDRAR